MGLFTAVSAYSRHVWPFAAKIADNTQTYCWHVYALNVGNLKTSQYCNIFKMVLSSKMKFTQYLWPFAAVSDFMAIHGANVLLAAIYKGLLELHYFILYITYYVIKYKLFEIKDKRWEQNTCSSDLRDMCYVASINLNLEARSDPRTEGRTHK